MNIFYDENMPYAAQFFDGIGQLVPFSGRELTASKVSSSDILLVRSITKVNEMLLAENTKLKFVGSATIGFDHIDTHYLASRSVPFYSAPGCNAVSVAEYVISALYVLDERYQQQFKNKTVAIIGAGNTGSRLAEKLAALSVNYVLCDPILENSPQDKRSFVSLDTALTADIISLHVPLTKTGQYPTYHLLDKNRLQNLRSDQILINACRGEVIDNTALLALKQTGHQVKLIMDVWENEPNIETKLIPYTEISTAHIAGYSLEGKARGTEMLYQKVCQQFGLNAEKKLTDFLPQADINNLEVNSKLDWSLLKKLNHFVYDVRRDDAIFRQQLAEHGFDYLRKTYPIRRENSAFKLSSKHKESVKILAELGFNCR